MWDGSLRDGSMWDDSMWDDSMGWPGSTHW